MFRRHATVSQLHRWSKCEHLIPCCIVFVDFLMRSVVTVAGSISYSTNTEVEIGGKYRHRKFSGIVRMRRYSSARSATVISSLRCCTLLRICTLHLSDIDVDLGGKMRHPNCFGSPCLSSWIHAAAHQQVGLFKMQHITVELDANP